MPITIRLPIHCNILTKLMTMIMKQIHFSVEESYSERIFFFFFFFFMQKIGSNILFGAFRGSLKDISKRSKKKNC